MDVDTHWPEGEPQSLRRLCENLAAVEPGSARFWQVLRRFVDARRTRVRRSRSPRRAPSPLSGPTGAVCTEGFVDESGGARPAGRIESRVVKRREDLLERVPFAHDRPVA